VFNMPSITTAQVVAVVGAVIAVAVAAGVHISADLKVAIVGLVAVVGGLLIHSDAKIRGARAANADKIAAAKK
jgi:hypothetical protein